MTCSSCGIENPVGHRFCGCCGAALSAVCPACGTPVVPGFRFCGACGEDLGAKSPVAAVVPDAAARPVIERRVCSVLFADLVGFTPLSESRDPEEVRELLSRYFDTARTVITRYGGVVEKFIGDAVMAVWGTPVAAEGDAERAVRTGLDLVSAVAALGREVAAEGLAARAGVVTGEVAASLGVVGEGMVAGDAVNTAARVQAAAEPGSVWVDTATQRLAAAGVGFRNTGAHALKGKADPVELWQATRVLSSLGGVQRVDGLEAPMIGREVEDRTLRELFHASVDRGAPRLVTVVGAAGSGKSRLGWEFEKYVDGLADSVAWHRGRCLSYSDGVAYWALAEAVRQRFGIAAEDPSDEASAKFRTGLERWIDAADERSFVGIRLGRLLGLTHPTDTGAALGQDELFAGWRLFLERIAADRPVVVLIEDAQHADDALLDFVEYVVDWSRQSPIYLVLLGRSELIERRSPLAGGRNRTSLTLDPLDEKSMRQLVTALVRAMPEPAIAAIVEQAQGNPLFAVETVRSLIDRDVIVPIDGEYRLVGDVGTLSVPDSLHALLAARLDALDPSLRLLLADAAVLGTNFFPEALVAVSGRSHRDVMASLAELVRREVLDVSTDPLSPERGSYLFSQNMLRQVVYDTLSRRDRKVRHLAVAAYLRRAYANDGDEVVEVVAQHYLDALSAAPSDEDSETLRVTVIETLTRSAERAERAGAPRRAAVDLVQVADLAGDGVVAADLRDRAARLATVGGLLDLALDQSRAAAELYRGLGRDRSAARARITTATALRNGARYDEARAELAAALDVLRTPADRDTVLAISELSGLDSLAGRANEAIEYSRQAMDLAQALGVKPDLMARVFTGLAWGCQYGNKHEEAVASIDHAIRLVEGDPNTAVWTRALIVLSDMSLTGHPLRSQAASRQARDNALRLGDIKSLSLSLFNLGAASIWIGQWKAVDETLREADQYGLADDSSVQQLGAMLAGLRGDVAHVENSAAALAAAAAEDIQGAMYAKVIEILVASASDDFPHAIKLAREALDRGNALGFRHETFVWSWTLAFRAAQASGDLTTRGELLDQLDAQTDGYWPALLLAERQLARSLDEGSEAAVDESIAALRAVGSPYHLAHGLLDQADALRFADPVRARACLDEAALLNEPLQAPLLIRRLHRQAAHADGSVPA